MKDLTDEQIRLRFFKELNEYQRLSVFKAFGVYPDDCTERLNHAIERRLLDAILKRGAAQTAPVNVPSLQKMLSLLNAIAQNESRQARCANADMLAHDIRAIISAAPSSPIAANSEDAKRMSDLSVTRILLDVVPGEDGMGQEIYAKTVKEVEDLLGRQGAQIEDLTSQAAQLHKDAERYRHITEVMGMRLKPPGERRALKSIEETNAYLDAAIAATQQKKEGE